MRSRPASDRPVRLHHYDGSEELDKRHGLFATPGQTERGSLSRYYARRAGSSPAASTDSTWSRGSQEQWSLSRIPEMSKTRGECQEAL